MAYSQKLVDRLVQIGGCSDGGCVVIRPVGMHTNGGCRCSTNSMTMRRVLFAYWAELGEKQAPRMPRPPEWDNA